MSIKELFDNKEWLLWDKDIKSFEQKAVDKYKVTCKDSQKFWGVFAI